MTLRDVVRHFEYLGVVWHVGNLFGNAGMIDSFIETSC